MTPLKNLSWPPRKNDISPWLPWKMLLSHPEGICPPQPWIPGWLKNGIAHDWHHLTHWDLQSWRPYKKTYEFWTSWDVTRGRRLKNSWHLWTSSRTNIGKESNLCMQWKYLEFLSNTKCSFYICISHHDQRLAQGSVWKLWRSITWF